MLNDKNKGKKKMKKMDFESFLNPEPEAQSSHTEVLMNTLLHNHESALTNYMRWCALPYSIWLSYWLGSTENTFDTFKDFMRNPWIFEG